MEEFTQIRRIIRILELLSMGRKLSTSQIKHYFKDRASLRTIQRDINVLLDSGIPLYADNASDREKMWYFPREYRKMLLPVVQKNELLSFYIFKSYLKFFAGTHFEKDLNSLTEKIEEIAPGEVYVELQDASLLMWNQDFGQYAYQDHDLILNTIIECITGNCWVTVTYQSRGNEKPKTYDLYPYRLFHYNGSLYLAAYNPSYENFISLAVHRLKKIRPATRQNRIPVEFDQERFRNERFGVFIGNIQKVILEIQPGYSDYFRNRTWHTTQKVTEKPDGKLILEMTVPLSPELVTWILGWHSGIKILAPEQLIQMIRSRIEETLSLYQ